MNICVFCSSSNQVLPAFGYAAEELGRLMGIRNHQLIYGGTNIGLMGVLARTVADNNARVTGIIPSFIASKGIANDQAQQLVYTQDMSTRKQAMASAADAFIALPGGFGTLEETLEVLTAKQLQLHNKPVVFINTNNFYSPLDAFFQTLFDKGFTHKRFRDLYCITNTPEAALDYIESYVPPDLKDKWTV